MAPTISLSPARVRFGEAATVSITGAPGSTVDLRTRKYPAASFTTIRSALVLDANGQASVVTRPDVNLRFQAVDLATAASSGTGGTDGLVTVEKRVTASARRVSVRTYSFTGSVNPLNPGATVGLYRNGVLQKSAIPVSAARTYSFTVRFSGTGTFTFQMRSPSTGYNALSASPSLSLRIY